MRKTGRGCVAILVLLTAALVFSLCWLLGAVGRAEAEAARVIDFTGLFQAIITVLGALITYRLLPWIKTNTAQKQQAMLQAAIDTAVYAAQQLYKIGAVQDRLDYAESWLRGKGYSVDRAQIEAAVRRMDSLRIDASEIIDLGEVHTE